MIRETTRIIFAVGLHARPANAFVKIAKTFECTITIQNISRNGEAVNAKNLVKIIKIACAQDHEVALTFNGSDEAEAADALMKFLEGNAEQR